MRIYRARVTYPNGRRWVYYILARSVSHAAGYANRYASILIEKL